VKVLFDQEDALPLWKKESLESAVYVPVPDVVIVIDAADRFVTQKRTICAILVTVGTSIKFPIS
jgi:hypothetical protein